MQNDEFIWSVNQVNKHYSNSGCSAYFFIRNLKTKSVFIKSSLFFSIPLRVVGLMSLRLRLNFFQNVLLNLRLRFLDYLAYNKHISAFCLFVNVSKTRFLQPTFSNLMKLIFRLLLCNKNHQLGMIWMKIMNIFLIISQFSYDDLAIRVMQ